MDNFVFWGSPEFARSILERLTQAGLRPTAVVCNPDRPAGRKHLMTPPPVKALIAQSGWPVEILQPETLDENFRARLFELKPDFFIVAAYAKIIPQEILAIPRLGTVGVHPSLLPKLRGATPMQSTILAGDAETGVTLYRMDAGMDHGPVLSQAACRIAPDETYATLHDKLAAAAAELLIKILPSFTAGKIMPHPQDESRATYTKKFAAADAFVEPAELAAAQAGDAEKTAAIDRKIRALNPEPGAWTLSNGRRVKLLAAEVAGKTLRLIKIQREGEKPVSLL